MNLEKKIKNTPEVANSQNNAVASEDVSQSPPLLDPGFWMNVRKDIVTLAEIIKDSKKEDKPDELSFLAKHWK